MSHAYQPLLPAASRYLQERWDQAAYRQHRSKVQGRVQQDGSWMRGGKEPWSVGWGLQGTCDQALEKMLCLSVVGCRESTGSFFGGVSRRVSVVPGRRSRVPKDLRARPFPSLAGADQQVPADETGQGRLVRTREQGIVQGAVGWGLEKVEVSSPIL